MRLYHCSRPERRSDIRAEGLRGDLRPDEYVFAWSTRQGAEDYRDSLWGGWNDTWSFDDRGRSEEAPSMSGEAHSRLIHGNVPPQDLCLVYEAR